MIRQLAFSQNCGKRTENIEIHEVRNKFGLVCMDFGIVIH